MDAVDRGVHDVERGRRRCRCLGMQCMARKGTRQADGDNQSCMRRNHTKTLLLGKKLMGSSKNSLSLPAATKLPANDSASFSFRFISVHSWAVRDRQ